MSKYANKIQNRCSADAVHKYGIINLAFDSDLDAIMKTLYDKLWESHIVRADEDGTTVLYIDRHLVHEVTSPQAFDGLRAAGRSLWRTSANLAVRSPCASTALTAFSMRSACSVLPSE